MRLQSRLCLPNLVVSGPAFAADPVRIHYSRVLHQCLVLTSSATRSMGCAPRCAPPDCSPDRIAILVALALARTGARRRWSGPSRLRLPLRSSLQGGFSHRPHRPVDGRIVVSDCRGRARPRLCGRHQQPGRDRRFTARELRHVSARRVLARARRLWIQSIFFTETLARHGYVVVAPDHSDALYCSSDGSRPAVPQTTPPAAVDPGSWNAGSYVGRRDDVKSVLDAIVADAALRDAVAPDRIGIAGHSLGGYVALAMTGGWPSWVDTRLRPRFSSRRTACRCRCGATSAAFACRSCTKGPSSTSSSRLSSRARRAPMR